MDVGESTNDVGESTLDVGELTVGETTVNRCHLSSSLAATTQAKVLVGNRRVLNEEAATMDQKELKIELILLFISTNLSFKEEISISFG